MAAVVFQETKRNMERDGEASFQTIGAILSFEKARYSQSLSYHFQIALWILARIASHRNAHSGESRPCPDVSQCLPRSCPEADLRRVHDEFDAVDWFLVVSLAICKEGSTMLAVP